MISEVDELIEWNRSLESRITSLLKRMTDLEEQMDRMAGRNTDGP